MQSNPQISTSSLDRPCSEFQIHRSICLLCISVRMSHTHLQLHVFERDSFILPCKSVSTHSSLSQHKNCLHPSSCSSQTLDISLVSSLSPSISRSSQTCSSNVHGTHSVFTLVAIYRLIQATILSHLDSCSDFLASLSAVTFAPFQVTLYTALFPH